MVQVVQVVETDLGLDGDRQPGYLAYGDRRASDGWRSCIILDPADYSSSANRHFYHRGHFTL